MVALQGAIRRVKNGKDGLVNIFSDSRAVRLFWVRAHAGIAGNERADELARRAALTKKTAADYDRFPLSYAKRVIRAASLEEWQERYAEEAQVQAEGLAILRLIPLKSRTCCTFSRNVQCFCGSGHWKRDWRHCREEFPAIVEDDQKE
ncbi:hypothetical protein EVAR_94477_1 [Eumeta japonica]|uniref:RNase H type-1 domain-containing protein n=1 Tax=Eumeta variegata TaxID=151549 RepID=A0A4C1UV47_EUMVA|nr:hypothetical protein EVAR_94477_1 [Eumeta japonica]